MTASNEMPHRRFSQLVIFPGRHKAPPPEVSPVGHLFGIALLLVVCAVTGASARKEQFILGADISWIDQRESNGVTYSDNGTVKDVFLILKDHRFNWIRLRLFVDPTATVPGCAESPYSTLGFCDLAHTLNMAQRAKAAGFRILLDFHYSDIWADPGKQFKPVSWADLSFDSLKVKVRTYTKETLRAFEARGVLPDMVQIGNEIFGGLIWPDGKYDNVARLAALVNAGIDGVKDVAPGILIMLHSIAQDSPSSWLDWVESGGVNLSRVDVFGLSYYSDLHGTPADLQTRVAEVAKNHPVKIAIAEYADNHRAVNDIIFNLPGEQGFGTFCWEPQEWGEALFDPLNKTRRTNAKIDLYTVMSKEYGNDDISGVAGEMMPRPFSIARGYGAANPGSGLGMLFTLQGRRLATGPGEPAPVHAASGRYLIVTTGGNGGRWDGGVRWLNVPNRKLF